MATEGAQPFKVSGKSSVALNTLSTAGTAQYRAVTRSGTSGGSAGTAFAVGSIVQTDGTAVTATPIGVLQNNPSRANAQCEIVVVGRTKMVCAGTILPGAAVALDSTGRAIPPVTGVAAAAAGYHQATNWVIGILDQEAAAASGDVITVLVNCLNPASSY